jgi:hypothetical protein
MVKAMNGAVPSPGSPPALLPPESVKAGKVKTALRSRCRAGRRKKADAPSQVLKELPPAVEL